MSKRDGKLISWTLSKDGMSSEESDGYTDKTAKVTSVVDRHRTSKSVEENDAGALWAEYTGIPWAFWAELGCRSKWPNIIFTWKEEELLRVRKFRNLEAESQKGKCKWVEKPSFSILWPTPSSGTHEEIWLTEGESDCAVLRFLGYDAYTLGSATEPVALITMQVLQELGVSRINIAYDADEAGQRGSRKTAESLASHGFEARLLNLLKVRRGYEKDISDILRFRGQVALQEAVVALLASAESVEDIRMDIVLAGEDEIEWLWDRILPAGNLVLLSGPPKAMKTNLLYFMMKAAAEGGQVLGREFYESRMLYYSEMPISLDRARANTILASLESRDHLFIRHEFAEAFAGKSWLERSVVLENDVRRYGIDLLILDTASSWFGLTGEEENNSTAIRTAFAPLRRIADKYNTTVLVVHHIGTSGEARPRGSGAFSAIPDVLLTQTINKDEQIELDILGRHSGMRGRIGWNWPEDVDEPIVHFDTDTSELASSLQEKEDKVLEAIRELGPSSTKEISRFIDMDPRIVRRALGRLAAADKVTRIGSDDEVKSKWYIFSIAISDV